LRKVVLTLKGNQYRPEIAIIEFAGIVSESLHLCGKAIAHPELKASAEHGVRLRRKAITLAHRPCLR
jgi:hypothetical protein